MVSGFFLRVWTASVVFLGVGPCCWGQGSKSPPVDRILDVAGSVLVINDLTVVVEDTTRLLNDLKYGSLVPLVEGAFKNFRNPGIDSAAGCIFYADRADCFAMQLQLGERAAFAETFLVDPQVPVPDSGPVAVQRSELPLADWLLYGRSDDRAVVSRERLFVYSEKAKERLEHVAGALKLAPKLDQQSCQIVNESGITFIEQFADDSDTGIKIPVELIDTQGEDLSDAEKKWLVDFQELIRNAPTALVGVKYREGVLSFRSRAQLAPEQSFEGVVDFSRVGQDWKPTLGLESKSLLFSASFQMAAFRSSAASRVVPRVFLHEAARRNGLSFLQGSMLQVLTELAGDSWNELSVSRIGMYQNDSASELGQFALIGVVDSSTPDNVFAELERLSVLTSPDSPAVNPMARTKEVRRLLEELQSQDSNLASRAETRLVLVGEFALPMLKNARDSDRPDFQKRLTRIIRRIESRMVESDSRVFDPEFWTTLNPGLRLLEKSSEIEGFETRTIRISPDASKSEQEIRDATQVMIGMFGPRWDSVQVTRVGEHFVFMFGSNQTLFTKCVQNVTSGKSEALLPPSVPGSVPAFGPIQLRFNLNRIARMYQPATPQSPAGPETDEFCWLDWGVDRHAMRINANVPAKQLVRLITLGIGF